MLDHFVGASPAFNLMEVKDSKTQGHCREARFEGSVEQRCEPMNKNRIRGMSAGRASARWRSPYPSRARSVDAAVVHLRWGSRPPEGCLPPPRDPGAGSHI